MNSAAHGNAVSPVTYTNGDCIWNFPFRAGAAIKEFHICHLITSFEVNYLTCQITKEGET